jgi:hypothetical protein
MVVCMHATDADGVNLHSDGLDNQPKRAHLGALHAILLQHASTIMATPRPIPTANLTRVDQNQNLLEVKTITGITRGSQKLLKAFVFGGGDLVFLENGGGAPSRATWRRRPDGYARENCSFPNSFPIDESHTRYKGLRAAAATIATESACAAACCAAAATDTTDATDVAASLQCELYQFYPVPSGGTRCWIGTPCHAEGSPPPGFRSRARVKPPAPGPAPHPRPSPPPPSDGGNATVLWNGASSGQYHGSVESILGDI